jgi:preprotein translocase subunit YajC
MQPIVLTVAQAGGAASPGGGYSWWLMMAAIFVIFYFLLIRPARKQQKRHQEMVSALKKGDKVITQGGIHGTVEGVDDDVVKLRVADGVKIELSRTAVSSVKSRPETDS